MSFLVRALVNALGLWIAGLLLSGITLPGAENNWKLLLYLLVSGAILAAVNMLVRPVVSLLSLPFIILTLGLFYVIVHAAMLMLTEWISGFTDFGFDIEHFGWAILGAIILGLVNILADIILPKKIYG